MAKKFNAEDISNKIGIPSNILAGSQMIYAIGRGEICIENYKGIIEYNQNIIKIQAKNYRIIIEGKRLNILYFTDDEMYITGLIETISYK